MWLHYIHLNPMTTEYQVLQNKTMWKAKGTMN